MKCVFCGGQVENKKTTFVYENDKYIVVENVPAEVCSKCGEKTYSPEVTDELLRFSKDNIEPVRTIKVPVFDFVKQHG